MEKLTQDGKVLIKHIGNGIFLYRFEQKADVDIDTAREMVEIGDELGRDFLVCANLVDARKMLFIDSEARKYLASQERNNLAAVAIVINSSIQRTLANLYFRFTVQATPTRLFTDIAEAETWLVNELKEVTV